MSLRAVHPVNGPLLLASFPKLVAKNLDSPHFRIVETIHECTDSGDYPLIRGPVGLTHACREAAARTNLINT